MNEKEPSSFWLSRGLFLPGNGASLFLRNDASLAAARARGIFPALPPSKKEAPRPLFFGSYQSLTCPRWMAPKIRFFKP